MCSTMPVICQRKFFRSAFFSDSAGLYDSLAALKFPPSPSSRKRDSFDFPVCMTGWVFRQLPFDSFALFSLDERRWRSELESRSSLDLQ